MKRLFTLVIILSCCSACKESPVNEQDLSNLEHKLDSLTSAAKQVWSKTEVPNLSVDELKKLRQLEYSVFSISSNSTSEEIGKFLSEKGLDRWDCFHVEKEHNENNLLFYCKRPVETPLRYLPNTVLGR